MKRVIIYLLLGLIACFAFCIANLAWTDQGFDITRFLKIDGSNQSSWTPSSTPVPNLNSDMVDSLHASSFTPANSCIAIDGTSTTTGRIPFLYGLSSNTDGSSNFVNFIYGATQEGYLGYIDDVVIPGVVYIESGIALKAHNPSGTGSIMLSADKYAIVSGPDGIILYSPTGTIKMYGEVIGGSATTADDLKVRGGTGKMFKVQGATPVGTPIGTPCPGCQYNDETHQVRNGILPLDVAAGSMVKVDSTTKKLAAATADVDYLYTAPTPAPTSTPQPVFTAQAPIYYTPNGDLGLSPIESTNNIFGNAADGTGSYSSDTTLTATKYFDDCTIDSGATLTLNLVKIHATGTLTVNGAISTNGNDGSDATTQTGANGGAVTGNLPADTGTAIAGTKGGTGTTTNGGDATAGTVGTTAQWGKKGGAGSAGGKYGAYTGGAGSGGSYNALRTLGRILFSQPLYGLTMPYSGGGGGGGGAGCGDGRSGYGGGGAGGGAGAKPIIIFAKNIINNGAITADGGTGGDAAPGQSGDACGGGGGGGGGGGYIILVYETYSGSGTLRAGGGAGGSGGAGSGAGAAGGDGNAGTDGQIIKYNLIKGVYE